MEVVSEPGTARALLHPMRRKMLEMPAEPASAASLARALELPRQRVNYHLRTLEDLGFLELAICCVSTVPFDAGPWQTAGKMSEEPQLEGRRRARTLCT